MATEHKPGRLGEVRGFAVSNARRTICVDRKVYLPRYEPGEWGVRFGKRYYPDHATPDPTRWDGMHGGTFLSPDEADEMADYLRAAAEWARAQDAVQNHEWSAD